LRYFETRGALWSNPCLVDAETGDVLHEYVEAYDGVFLYSGREGFQIGFDDAGLFVVTQETPHQELFRSKQFTQHLLEPDATEAQGGGRVELRDVASGRSFLCHAAISGGQIPWPDGRMQDDQGRIRSSYPRSLKVERREVTASHFAYAVGPLKEICAASVATGNPVRWC
jgi:hypothetical protein